MALTARWRGPGTGHWTGRSAGGSNSKRLCSSLAWAWTTSRLFVSACSPPNSDDSSTRTRSVFQLESKKKRNGSPVAILARKTKKEVDETDNKSHFQLNGKPGKRDQFQCKSF